MTSADDDYTHNNISHEFLSTKSQTLDAIFRVFTLLLPDSLFTFSAAKYCKAGHIKPHDDRAYTQVGVCVCVWWAECGVRGARSSQDTAWTWWCLQHRLLFCIEVGGLPAFVPLPIPFLKKK